MACSCVATAYVTGTEDLGWVGAETEKGGVGGMWDGPEAGAAEVEAEEMRLRAEGRRVEVQRAGRQKGVLRRERQEEKRPRGEDRQAGRREEVRRLAEGQRVDVRREEGR